MVTQERLKELFSYDPHTGHLTRLIEAGGQLPGVIAGSYHITGHLDVSVDGAQYKAHRLIWLYVYGEWPKNQIDHINGAPGDNRICNLRDVTRFVNQQNQRRPRSDNTSGYLGVTFCKARQKYTAQIWVSKKNKNLGFYEKPEDAHEAYLRAKRIYHSGCTI